MGYNEHFLFKYYLNAILCIIVSDAIKKQLKFKNISQHEIEDTIKYVLAQAPFNLKRKLNKVPLSV